MKVVILRNARSNLIEAAAFYEENYVGLGEKFITSIENDIALLKRIGPVHRKIDGYYRMVASKFPFSIFYKVENSQIRIHRILDNRRDPQVISEMLN